MRALGYVIDRLRRQVRRSGFDLIRYSPVSSPHARRVRLFQHHPFDVVLDVGAHDGGYGLELRRMGYAGRIVSFEPLPTAYAALAERAAGDPRWEALNVALGAEDGTAVLNVSGSAESSSLLPMLPRHTEAAPATAYVAQEEVPLRRLDGLFGRYVRTGERALLKIDVQGYERAVLEGAGERLDDVAGVQAELSLVPLYAEAPSLTHLVDELAAHGLVLMSVEPAFCDPVTGQLLQVDGLFFREGAGHEGAA